MQNNLFSIAEAQILKEYDEEVNEAIRQAEIKKTRKLEALGFLRPTLQTILNNNSEDSNINKLNTNLSKVSAVSNNLPSINERIYKEIRSFRTDENINQQLIFSRLAAKFEDIATHPKASNVRSQITTILKKLTDAGELTLFSVGRANVPNTYRKSETEEFMRSLNEIVESQN